MGIKVFIEQNWPKIRKAVPDAVLQIVGNVGADLEDLPAGVVVAGVVPDLAAVYKDATIIINPVEYGTGLSIKAIEALCAGRCLVTTAIGVRGINLAPDTARQAKRKSMHRDIAELLLDAEARHGYEEAALRFAREDLSADRVFRELFNTMELRLYS